MSASIGIIGAGAIAKHHARGAVDAGIDVRHIIDMDLARAESLAETCQAKASTDIEQVLNDDQVTGVVLAIPNTLHRPISVQALSAGKDILLEKPMGLNLAECQAINEAAEANGRIVQVGLVNRYTAVGHAAKRFVDEGSLGNIYHAKAQIYRRRGIPGLGGWFTTKAQSGGGAMIDIGVHAIDLVMHLMSFPNAKSLLGRVYNNFGKRMGDYVFEDMWAGPPRLDGVCDVDDSAHAMITFDNGASFELNVTWAGNFPAGSLPESMIGIFGDQGGMTFEFAGDQLRLAQEEFGHNIDKQVILPKRDEFAEQLTDFVKAIETRKVAGPSGLQATEVQKIIDAVYESSETGSAVNFA